MGELLTDFAEQLKLQEIKKQPNRGMNSLLARLIGKHLIQKMKIKTLEEIHEER